MKKTRKFLTLVLLSLLLLGVVMNTAACTQYNTISTKTTYKYGLIGDITASSGGNTISDRLWEGIKDAAGTGEYYRYYPLAEYSGNDGTSVETARAEAIIKQISLANANGAVTVIIPSEYTDVFDKVFDGYTDSTYKNTYFLITAYPGSAVKSKALKLNKMSVLTVESSQLGYLFGYTAVMAGFTPGYVGISGDESAALYCGMVQGAQAAAAKKNAGVSEYPYAYVSAGGDVSAAAATVYEKCDIILSDLTCEAEVIKAAGTAGKFVMSMTGMDDASVKFAFVPNKLYAEKLGSIISKIGADGAKEYAIGVGDEIYTFTDNGDAVFTDDFADDIDDLINDFRKNNIEVSSPDAETSGTQTDNIKDTAAQE